MISSDECALDRYMDKIADSYGYDRVTKNVANRLRIDIILQHIAQTDKILDIGCANGLYLRHIAPHCGHIIGIDLNERVLAYARQKIAEENLHNAEVLRCNARNLDFDDASFDLAYCFATLSVVPDDISIIQEIARVLRPGGKAILDITGRLNLSHLHFRRWWNEQDIDFHAYRYGEITAILQRFEFNIVDAHAFGATDQWKSIPILKKFTLLDRLFHGSGRLDLDYRISNRRLFFSFASRWYLICQRMGSFPK